MRLKLALNPINVASYIKQGWLYHQYLHDQKTALRFRKEYVPFVDGNTVLDYGCGRGRHVAIMAQLGYDVFGVDQARFSWWKNVKATHRDRTIFSNYGASRLATLGGSSFDLCLCFLVLYLVEDDQGLLNQFYRVLKPGGYLVLQVPNANNLWTRRTGKYLNDVETIKRYYTQESITEKVEKAGFTVEKVWFEKYYDPKHLKAVNTALGLLPDFVGKRAERQVPAGSRGLINMWGRK